MKTRWTHHSGRAGQVKVPPIKCQGIKTKLVPFILSAIRWDPEKDGRWIEPFLGSGVVAFNLAPRRAILADANPHIINFYRAIQTGELTPARVRSYLSIEGERLAREGEEYYYHVRARFNREGNPLDFLFLNRAGFNGLIRFNSGGECNVPFCRKPERFTQAYITKITNQVRWVALQMQGKDWEFRTAVWEETIESAEAGDFLYLDPPYEGRHADYYNRWTTEQTKRLIERMLRLPCGFALSMWLENPYRRNLLVDYLSGQLAIRVYEHFYHIGGEETNRNWVREALVIHPEYVSEGTHHISPCSEQAGQTSLF
ncbi:MAG: Dam family site-specific DNA-(adenine-N6)-methyltransferase [Fimbriimonadales bacterium]|nr:Dam family site-specific DNA-(adenine-N6)-methyltransferase [Fimbriimonadales bacterium]